MEATIGLMEKYFAFTLSLVQAEENERGGGNKNLKGLSY